MDYDKLLNLDYTAYEHVEDFRKRFENEGIKYPAIDVKQNYQDGVPEVKVTAVDVISGKKFTRPYKLEDVTEEEFEEVMFDIWRDAMEELVLEKLFD